MPANSYLMASLLKNPALLSARFNPQEHVFDLKQAKKESSVANRTANAKTVFGGLWDDDDDTDEKPYPYYDGIALIGITGVLLNRFAWSFSMATGYNAVRAQLQAALDDPMVQGIVFDVNSPGGMVQGCFELADEIFAARKEKPMLAVVDAQCTSAAYALACATGNIAATPSADIGSIGVLCMHVDLSEALENEGVDVTFIYAGAHKIDGNPYQPLPKGVKADFQASIDLTYESFVSMVARNRGLTAQAVRNTEAQVYNAQDALNLGLIDSVATPSEAITAFRENELSGSSKPLGVFAMTEKTQPVAAATVAPDNTAILAAAAATAKEAERTRIGAILGCDDAKERNTLATHLAMNTELSVDQCKAILKAAPVPAAPVVAAPAAATTEGAFKAAMAKDNPNVSAGVEAPQEVDEVGQILKHFQQASGQKLKTA